VEDDDRTCCGVLGPVLEIHQAVSLQADVYMLVTKDINKKYLFDYIF
jgi:hypothetical protein